MEQAKTRMIEWVCGDCDIDGVVEVKRPIDTWRVMHQIELDHKDKSPVCDSIKLWPKDGPAVENCYV